MAANFGPATNSCPSRLNLIAVIGFKVMFKDQNVNKPGTAQVGAARIYAQHIKGGYQKNFEFLS